MGDFSKRLKIMQQTWATNREERAGFNDAFGDGVHVFQLQGFTLRESKTSGELMAMAEHYCLEGESAGDVYTQFFNLEKQNDDGKVWGQIFLAQVIEALGYETPEDMGELEERLAAIAAEAPKYTARIKTNKEGYKNLTILRVLEQSASPEYRKNAEEDATTEVEETPEAETTPEEEVKPEPEANADDEAAEPEPQGEETATEKFPSRQDLISFCEGWDIEVNDVDHAPAIAARIREYEWKKDDLTEPEIKVLAAVGAVIKETPKVAPKAPPKPPPHAPKPAAKAPTNAAKPLAKPAAKTPVPAKAPGAGKPLAGRPAPRSIQPKAGRR